MCGQVVETKTKLFSWAGGDLVSLLAMFNMQITTRNRNRWKFRVGISSNLDCQIKVYVRLAENVTSNTTNLITLTPRSHWQVTRSGDP